MEKKIIIHAPENSDKNFYVKSLSFNNKLHTKNWISHFDLMKGGVLNFLMSPVPNKGRGVSREAFPYSMSSEK